MIIVPLIKQIGHSIKSTFPIGTSLLIGTSIIHYIMFSKNNCFLFYFVRPKCDPLKDFSLTLERKSRNTDCIKIGRPWWAIQVIPLGFIPTFNSGMENVLVFVHQITDTNQYDFLRF